MQSPYLIIVPIPLTSMLLLIPQQGPGLIVALPRASRSLVWKFLHDSRPLRRIRRCAYWLFVLHLKSELRMKNKSVFDTKKRCTIASYETQHKRDMKKHFSATHLVLCCKLCRMHLALLHPF